MFSTKSKQESIFLSREDILKLATEEEIFKHYLGDFELRKMFNSPLRKDPVPSFNIYVNSMGEMVYKDFGGTQGSCIDLVMNIYHLSYKEALLQIYKDLNLGIRKESKLMSRIPVTRKDSVIKVKIKKYTEAELDYWKKRNISKEILDRYHVYSCSEVWLNGNLFLLSTPSNPIFAYYFPLSNKLKIYRPLDTSGKKWLTNCSLEDIQGLHQLPSAGKCLIITKSLKDVMVFNSFGFTAIAPHGEGMHIPDNIVNTLKQRFTKIVTVYDNDEPGVKASIKLNEQLGSTYWNIPKKYEVKDISDFVVVYGTSETLNLLQSLRIKCDEC